MEYRNTVKENIKFISDNIVLNTRSWLCDLEAVIGGTTLRDIRLAPNNEQQCNLLIEYLIQENDIMKYKKFLSIWKTHDRAIADQFEANLRKRLQDKKLIGLEDDNLSK